MPKNNSRIAESAKKSTGFDREEPKEGYISSEKGKKIINDLRLMSLYNNIKIL